MKKCLSLILAGVMLLLCAVSFAESTLTTTISSEGAKFDVTFDLPAGAQVLYEGWTEGSLYQANILLQEGEYLYLAVDGSSAGEPDPVTYNEENGYDDAKMLEMIDEFYGDEYTDLEKQVITSNYGTKIAVINSNDEFSPMAYAWTVWNNFEIGVTLNNLDGEGNFTPIREEQVQSIAAFVSELWAHVKVSADGVQTQEQGEELTPEEQELATVSEWLGSSLSEEESKEILNWDLDTVRSKLEAYDGELQYYTKDEIAEILYQQIAMMKQFVEAMQNMDESDLGAMVYMIIPIFDNTEWIAEENGAKIVCVAGEYEVTLAGSLEDVINGTNTTTIHCVASEDSQSLTGEDGSTFTVIDEDDFDVLVWKNAEGKEVKFSLYSEQYVGRFESGEYKMEIAWQDGYYKMALAKSWEAIEQGSADVLSYLAKQSAGASNLNGNWNEESEQADHGYCYFSYDESDQTYEFNNGDDLEMTFTKVAE